MKNFIRRSWLPACVAFLATAALTSAAIAAKPDMSIHGKPPLGAFGISTLEQIDAAASINMNLAFSYSPSSAAKQLDPTTPEGAAIARHRMKVMYPLNHRFTRVRLAAAVKPEDTTIAVEGDVPRAVLEFPASGYLIIEGERIEYSGRNETSFTGCRRGVGGTRAGSHPRGLLLCNSEGLRKEILTIKDSPHLWGFWQVDDARPRERDSLREMSRIIRLTDRDAAGRPNNHIIVMGIGGTSALSNFAPGIADALGVYPYPYHKGQLDQNTRRQMDYIMARARSEQPDIGLIGLYQTFGMKENVNWAIMPTPEQIREDMLSFFNYGADGVVAWIFHWENEQNEHRGLDSSPEAMQMVAALNRDILDAKVARQVPPVTNKEWYAVLTGERALPTPRGQVLVNLDQPEIVAAWVKSEPRYLSTDNFSVAGQKYPVKVSFPAYDKNVPQSDRWPIAQFNAAQMVTSDWSKARYLEQPLYNPGEDEVVVWLLVEDTDGNFWRQADAVIPPRVPALLRIPISDLRFNVNPVRVKRYLLWESDPPVPVEFYLGSPRLVPAH